MGCGVTRAFVNVMHGKFSDSLDHNRLVVIIFPVIFLICLMQLFSLCRSGIHSPPCDGTGRRRLFQETHDVPFPTPRRQPPASGVDNQSQIQTSVPLAYPELLTQDSDRSGDADSADDGDATLSQWQSLRRHHEARRQLLQPQAAAVLRRRLFMKLWMNTGLIPKRRQSRIARDRVRCRRAPAGQFAGILQLDLFRWAQVLPALAQEPEDLIHAAGISQAQANGAVEDVLADPDVVAVTAALKVDRPHEIGFVEFVGGPGLGTRVLLTRQQRSQADPRRGQAVALKHALDRGRVGQRADAEPLEFGQDGRGPDEAVAAGGVA
jgi:hypothetical protein